MHATSHLLKLQTNHVILDGHSQAYPGMPKKAFEIYLFQNCWSSIVDFWTTAFRQKRILENQHCLYISRSVCWHVSMSVSKHFFSKTTHMVFSEIPLKSDFSGKKNSVWGYCSKIPQETLFLGFC